MGITADPAWEFYYANPEVEEIIKESGKGVTDKNDSKIGFCRLYNARNKATAVKHTKQVVFAYLYCCTKFNLLDIGIRLEVCKKTLLNWRLAMGLKGRNKR